MQKHIPNSVLSILFRLNIALLILHAAHMEAQENQYMFKTMHKEIGLSNNNVISFLRDSKGFIWFGTADGLNRFDGYTFKVLKHIPGDTNSIRSSAINFLAEDYEGKIWIGAGNYLEIFDPETEKIKHTSSIFNGKLPYEYETKWELHKDRFGHYWYSSSRQGLFKYFVAEDSLIQVLDANDSPIFNQSYRITGIAEDSDGNIFSVTNKGEIIKINNKSSSPVDTIQLPVTSDNFFKLFIDSDDNIWCQDRNNNLKGLIYINNANQSINLLSSGQGIYRLNSDIITAVSEDEEGNIWIGTDHGGLNIIQKSTGKVQYCLNNPLNSRSLAENTVTGIYRDYEGFMWIGSFKKGISFYHKNLFKFRHFKIEIVDEQINSLNDIDNFAEDNKGNIWIGTNGVGLIYYERTTQKYKRYAHNPDNPGSLSADIIIGLTMDSKNNLWIGTYFGGLNKWDGKKFTTYKSDSTNPFTLTDDRIWDICEDSEGMLWIATLLGGVNVLDPKSGKVLQVYRWLNDTTIRSNVVFSIIEDRKGRMWFATVDGVRSFDKKTQKFNYFEHDPKNPNSLSDNYVFEVFEDSRGFIWAATANGLNILDEPGNKFTILRESDGLSDNRILTIQEDNENTIWVSTTNGLSNIRPVFNPKDGSFKFTIYRYSDLDGLQGKEFNQKAAFKTSKGELLFGGSNGFNLFVPENIKVTESDANIVFTDLKVYSRKDSQDTKKTNEYELDRSISYVDEITLRYDDNLFTIEFSNLNFFHPERRLYQYKLDGFNDNWIETDSKNRRVTYSNLDPGNYLLRVKVTRADGTWNTKEATLKIRILPPWWKTWWFRISFSVFLISLITTLFYLRINRLKSQKKLLEEKIFERTNELVELNTVLEERQEEIGLQNEELNFHRNKLEKLVEERTSDLERALKKAEESDQLKSAFLANMSHEIRTPMNAIVGFSYLIRDEKLETPERNEYIDIIQKNCDSLLVIINDILDISKIESNQVVIVRRIFDVYKMLNDLCNYFKIKIPPSIEFRCEKPEEIPSLIINHDEIRIRQVLQNLIDNAIKFTENGHITIRVDIFGNELCFSIEDTGIGINQQDFHKVFVPFNKIEFSNSKFYSGAGLGLAICKRIAKLINGSIDFESEPGKGSTFRFSFPFEYAVKPKPKAEADQLRTPNYQTITEILVAEDEPANYYLVQKILSKTKTTIIWAKNGQEAVDYVQNNPDNKLIVLMDIKMPVLDGIEACKQIKIINSSIQVIAVTAYAYESEKLEILKNDFADYITKPIKPTLLIGGIERLIGEKIS